MKPIEVLLVDQPRALPAEVFHGEAVLAVEDASDPQAAEPGELPTVLEVDDRWREVHRAILTGPQRDSQGFSPGEFAFEPRDQGVPLREFDRIGEDGPNAFRRGIDDDFRAKMVARLGNEESRDEGKRAGGEDEGGGVDHAGFLLLGTRRIYAEHPRSAVTEPVIYVDFLGQSA